jgi:dextranase
MKYLSRMLLFALFLSLSRGIFVAQPIFDIIPDKAFYFPGDTVTLNVRVDGQSGRVVAVITHLTEIVTELEGEIEDGVATLTYTPSDTALIGYGVDAQLISADGETLASATTAFDVLNHWTDAPRYGFLSAFGKGRDNYNETNDWLLKHHITGLQFYDWQYLWEDLLPEEDEFTDGLGRPQSMMTIRRLIDEVDKLNIAAMPYTAIYGATTRFYRENPEWALFVSEDKPYTFGEDFLAIMDPTPGTPWNKHLLNEFADVLDNTLFDGIHIDQYGAPKTAKNYEGEVVDLYEVMPEFINQTKALVDKKRGEEGAVIFNAVGNWPVDTVAPSNQDAVYIEVWPPHNDFMDLHRIVVGAQQLGGNKPVIIAGYIHPDRVVNWRLADSIIFASGGFHIETGEPLSMLADPYFPEYGNIDAENRPIFENLYDFLVRYENVLSINTTPAPRERAKDVDLGEIRTVGITSRDRVLPIIRQGEGFETFSFVNTLGLDRASWNDVVKNTPTPQTDVEVKVRVTQQVKNVWSASPDGESLAAQALQFSVEDDVLSVTLPSLDYWTMMVVEYE